MSEPHHLMAEIASPAVAMREHYAAARFAPAYAAALTVWQTEAGPARRLAGLLAIQAAFRLGEMGWAQALIPDTAAAWQDHAAAPERFDLLAVSVVVQSELSDFASALESLRQLHAHAARADSLRNHVRARGTAAVCLAMLGDPWAALRLLSEAASHLADLHDEPESASLESTVLLNHAGICLQAARMLRDMGDEAAALAQLDDAERSTARTRALAFQRQDARLAAFTDVHEAETVLLRGKPHSALAPLRAALDEARAHGLTGHVRRLGLVFAQALTESGQARHALQELDRIAAVMRPGHEVACHLSLHEQRHAARRALGDAVGAVASLEQWRCLQLRRHAAQLDAQSRFARLRLELEHLYRQPLRRTR